MTISADDVARLLHADQPGATLVVVEGRAEVIDADELESGTYRGALQVISRDQLVKVTGGRDLSERELAEQAENLQVAVRDLGV